MYNQQALTTIQVSFTYILHIQYIYMWLMDNLHDIQCILVNTQCYKSHNISQQAHLAN